MAAVTCSQAGEPLRLVLQWYPQSQFAGYFVARDKGFYAERGIDIEIIPGGPDVQVPRFLYQGKADFGTMFLSAAIDIHEAGVPVVNVAQIVQQSALMLVARKSSGITTIKDLDGRRVGLWNKEFQIQPRFLFKREGIQVRVLQQSPSFDLFMRGGLDAVSAMWYNEYYALKAYGLDDEEMVRFYFSDMEFDFPEDGIYCLASTYKDHPQLVEAFVEATVQGWEYAFSHANEALEIVLKEMKKHRVRANRGHQRWMLLRMRDVILSGGGFQPDVRLKREDFDLVTAALKKGGFINEMPAYDSFCKGPAR